MFKNLVNISNNYKTCYFLTSDLAVTKHVFLYKPTSSIGTKGLAQNLHSGKQLINFVLRFYKGIYYGKYYGDGGGLGLGLG